MKRSSSILRVFAALPVLIGMDAWGMTVSFEDDRTTTAVTNSIVGDPPVVTDDGASSTWTVNGDTLSLALEASGKTVESIENPDDYGGGWQSFGRHHVSQILVEDLGSAIASIPANGREGAGGYLKIMTTGTAQLSWSKPEIPEGADSFPQSLLAGNGFHLEAYGNAGPGYLGHEERFVHRYLADEPDYMSDYRQGGNGGEPTDADIQYNIPVYTYRNISAVPVLFDTAPSLTMYASVSAKAREDYYFINGEPETGEGFEDGYILGKSETKVNASFKVEFVPYDPSVAFTGFLNIQSNPYVPEEVEVDMGDPWSWYELRIPGIIDHAQIQAGNTGLLPVRLDKPREFRSLTTRVGAPMELNLDGHTLTLGNDGTAALGDGLIVSEGTLTLRNGVVDAVSARVGGGNREATLILEANSKLASGVLVKGKAGAPAILDVRENEAVHSVTVSDYGTFRLSGGKEIGESGPAIFMELAAKNGLALAEISGEGTKASFGPALTIGGEASAGALHVLDGAHVSATSLVVGGGGGEGELLVDAGTVSVQTLEISSGYFYRDSANFYTDGSFGHGEVTIMNGGKLDARDLYIGPVPFTEGKLTVTGAGSHVQARNLYFGLQDQARIVRPGWYEMGGAAASANLAITQGATVDVSNAWDTYPYPDSDIQHSVVISGEGSALRAPGIEVYLNNTFVDVNNGGLLSTGKLTVSGNQVFRVQGADSVWEGDKMHIGFISATGNVEVLDGGLLRANDGMEISQAGGESTLIVDGEGAEVLVQNGYIIAGLREPQRTNTNINQFVGAAQIVVSNGGEIVAPEIFIGPRSVLSGNGGKVIANVYSIGLISPGSSPGTLTIEGNLTLLNDSTLKMEIGGLVAGSQYDQLIVTGNMTLDGGAIEFAFINGFAPQTGQTFELFDVAGSFSGLPEFVVTGLLPGWTFETGVDEVSGKYTMKSLSDATAVPEPSTWMLLGVGVAALWYARRRRASISRSASGRF